MQFGTCFESGHAAAEPVALLFGGFDFWLISTVAVLMLGRCAENEEAATPDWHCGRQRGGQKLAS